MSAKIVQFPYRSTADRDTARSLLDWHRSRGESATIVILPIVRIERPDPPAHKRAHKKRPLKAKLFQPTAKT